MALLVDYWINIILGRFLGLLLPSMSDTVLLPVNRRGNEGLFKEYRVSGQKITSNLSSQIFSSLIINGGKNALQNF